MTRCDYCGYNYQYPICPYDGTVLDNISERVCNNRTGVRHDLSIPSKYVDLLRRFNINDLTVAACPNCRTPYLYSYLTQEERTQFNQQRQAAGCFIATAALGSHLHPHIQSLRDFRDNILLRSRHRHSFENLLNLYYRFSPPIARAMARNLPLKVLLRYVLVYPVVFGIRGILPLFNIFLGIERDVKRRSRLR